MEWCPSRSNPASTAAFISLRSSQRSYLALRHPVPDVRVPLFFSPGTSCYLGRLSASEIRFAWLIGCLGRKINYLLLLVFLLSCVTFACQSDPCQIVEPRVLLSRSVLMTSSIDPGFARQTSISRMLMSAVYVHRITLFHCWTFWVTLDWTKSTTIGRSLAKSEAFFMYFGKFLATNLESTTLALFSVQFTFDQSTQVMRRSEILITPQMERFMEWTAYGLFNSRYHRPYCPHHHKPLQLM